MNTVVAEYEGRKITGDDIAYQLYLLENSDTELATLQYLIVDAILEDAEKEGLSVDDSLADEKLRLLEKSGSLQEILSSTGLSQSRLRHELLKDEIVNLWMEAEHNIKDEDLKQYYRDHFADEIDPEIVHLRHILITITNRDDPEEREEAEKRMEEIENSKLSFENLAMRYSECPSAVNGGDLGNTKISDLYPEIAMALKDRQPGPERFVVETEMGLHLIEFLERKVAGTMDEEAKRKIARKKFSNLKNKATLKALAGRIKRNLVML